MAKGNYEFSKNETFVNPYNFVALSQSTKVTEDIKSLENQEKLSGSMTCTLYVKDAIAIPDVEKKKIENEHATYSFTKDPDGNYMIPASSIRGPIRSVFETATNSCYSTMREDARLHMRNSTPAKAGILKKEGEEWKLYRAKRYMLKANTFSKAEKIKNGKHGFANEEVWNEETCPMYIVKKDQCGKYIEINRKKIYNGNTVLFLELTKYGKELIYKSKKGYPCGPVVKEIVSSGGKEGILVLGEDIFNKHHESIFVDTKSRIANGKEVKDAIKGLEETKDVYRNSSINREYQKKHHGYCDYERMKENGCIPVWYYQSDDKKLYLQFASIGRKAFQRTLNELVKSYVPCKNREHLCKACRLFGMTGEQSLGSRVRFTDARIIENKGTEELTLAELGTPRSSYLPFYATGKISEKGYDDIGTTIRGRKFYWHTPQNYYKEINNGQKKTNRNATMELITSGSQFQFDVYFDGITEEELRELVWSLNFWENKKDGNMLHKIGHGKPIGLGSVKITVDEIKERKFSTEAGYSVSSSNRIDYEGEEPMKETEAVKELKKICDFEQAQKVHYPYVVLQNEAQKGNADKGKNDLANHQWFTHNKGKLGSGEKPKNLLPKIMEENQELPILEFEPKEDTYQKQGGNRGYYRKNNGKK